MNYQKVNRVIHPTNLEGTIGAIHLGNIYAANDQKYFKEHDIKSVLSVGKGIVEFLEHKSDYQSHLVIEIEDHPDEELLPYLDQGADFIKENVEKCNIYVHCFAGISRSTSMIIAYLMKYKNYQYMDALKLIQQQRSVANPNPGFKEQLLQYYEILQKKSSQNLNKEQENQIQISQNTDQQQLQQETQPKI